MSALILTQIVSTAIMTGVIWIIQLVHYPTYRFIDSSKFLDFQRFHQRSITWIVLPAMVVELCTGILLLISQNLTLLSGLNIGSIVLIWLVTFFISVPCHNQLEIQKNDVLIDRLIHTNWIRTILWTLRLVMVLFFSLE